MKQFWAIFRFELSNYMKNKMFVGITVVIVLALAVGLSFPRIESVFKDDAGKLPTSSEEKTKLAIGVNGEMDEATVLSIFQSAFGDKYEIKAEKGNEKELTKAVKSGKYDNALLITSPLSFKYITETKEMSDTTTARASEVLIQIYRMTALTNAGVTPIDAQHILMADVKNEVVVTGNDQTMSFMYTYVIILMLYMALLIYGQFVSQSVATEKSSRAMEMLITSAKPVNLMFGKVLGSGFAGLIQLVVLLFSSFGFYTLNKEYWENNFVVNSIFGMPLNILLYAILFFILGFFIYAFMYGALGSLATRSEDLNTLVMPVTFIFIVAFMIVVTAITSGKLDSTLMIACSYIPLTSPMAMFARIAMGSVQTYEIVISLAILVVSEIAIGYLAAVIYKAGVLMYGNAPKFKDILKIFKKQKKAN
ncbi:MAG: ABC transporter permease [Oscillospiraceae bacterium]